MHKKTPWRIWYYFRQGWSLYFAFIFAAINTLTVTYYLAIENYPTLKQIFPSFVNYIVLVALIGVPLLGLIGYAHFRKSPAYRSEVGVGWENNPYAARNLINSELNLQLNLQLLKMMIKLSNNEKITKEEMDEVIKTNENLSRFINSRTFSNRKDTDYLKKISNF